MPSERELPTCPACAGALRPLDGRVFALGCEHCHGRWLDRSTTEEVVRGVITLADEAGEAEAQGDRAQTPYRGAPRVGSREREWRCGATGLGGVRVGEIGIDLDVCPGDGTWFEAAGLDAVGRHDQAKGAVRNETQAMELLIERARRPSTRARRWHPFW